MEQKIYIADLTAYNYGYLHGAWINVSEGVAAMTRCLKDILATSPLIDSGEEIEEYMIHDWEGFGDLDLTYESDFYKIYQLAELVNKYDGYMLSYILKNYAHPIQNFRAECEILIKDHYIGCIYPANEDSKYLLELLPYLTNKLSIKQIEDSEDEQIYFFSDSPISPCIRIEMLEEYGAKVMATLLNSKKNLEKVYVSRRLHALAFHLSGVYTGSFSSMDEYMNSDFYNSKDHSADGLKQDLANKLIIEERLNCGKQVKHILYDMD